MVLDTNTHVCIDYFNVTNNILYNQSVLYWCLLIEHLHPAFHFIEGVDNVVAHTLSILPMKTLNEVDLKHTDADPDYDVKECFIEQHNEALLEIFLLTQTR